MGAEASLSAIPLNGQHDTLSQKLTHAGDRGVLRCGTKGAIRSPFCFLKNKFRLASPLLL